MYPFWDSIIKPLFEALQPREIVEIGADYGHNTRNILTYCKKTDSRAHIIDPQPKFDPEVFFKEYEGVVTFYQSMSLNALPLIDHMDAVLIDGDHNWYTVYNELKLIEKQCRQNEPFFPLVLIHDVTWPYARRDMYYNPETIPQKYRMPYAQKGLDPDSVELLEEGGLNPHLCNAVDEHNLRNGVLTAVEDFVKESDQLLELIKVPGFNGLGILYPVELKESNPQFSAFIKNLSALDIISNLITSLEKSRLESVIACEDTNQKLWESESKQRRESKEFKKELQKSEKILEKSEVRLAELAVKRRLESEQFKADIEENKRQFKIIEEKRQSENQAFTQKIEEQQKKIDALDQQIHPLMQEKKQLNKEKDQYSRWVSQLQEQFNALMQSNRWRVGHALISLATLSMFKKNFSMATDHIKRIFHQVDYFRSIEDRFVQNQARHIQNQIISKSYPQKRHNLTVAVIAWDVGHNPLGRAYLLAEVLSRYFHVILLGPSFPRYNTAVWEPLKNSNIEVLKLPGKDFPEFLGILEKTARRVEADMVIACKSRLPAVQLGLMIKAFKNRPVFIDIDDYELSFFKQKGPVSFKEISDTKKFTDLAIPFEETWTRFTENLIQYADGVFVSNPALKKKFGGMIIPHARDEMRFDPSLYDKHQRRKELGIDPEDKIVLFLGTPRERKGVTDVLNAVKECNKNNYKLCLIGSPPDKKYKDQLKRQGGSSLIMLPDQPFDKLAENLIIADLVCLIQDPESEISKYQLPAKVIDAVFMGIPVLSTQTDPLAPLISAGTVEPVTKENLCQAIDRILSDSDRYRLNQLKRRELFLKQYSYAAIGEKLFNTLLNALDHPKPLAANALDFMGLQKTILPKKPASAKIIESSRDGMNVVLFWKQNDTGLYGRRSDMFIKYLSRRPQIRKIAVFDMPIAVEALRDKAKNGGIIHDRMIYRETMLRNWGVRDTDVISFHTFIFSKQKEDLKRQVWRYPEPSEYMKFIKSRLDEQDITSQESIFWFYPENAYIPKIVKYFKPRLKVVDLVDDDRTWPGLSGVKRLQLTKHYKDVLKTADLALANCQNVRQSLEKYHPDIKLIPNGCELEPPPDLSADSLFKDFQSVSGPKLGYVGNLEKEKIDAELVRYLAERRPDWHIFLIGSTHANPDILKLDVYSNIHFVGVVQYPDVRAWVKAFDVAILPHLNSTKTQSMNPLKLYVYCSVGVPVVSTDIENLDELKSFISIAGDYEDFLRKIEAVLANKQQKTSTHLKNCLDNNSWDQRVDQVLKELKSVL